MKIVLALWLAAGVVQAPPEGSAPPATSAPPAAGVPTGAQLIAEANPRCGLCHTIAGKGNPKGPLDGVGSRRSREEIKSWIRTPVEMAKKHGKTRKPPMVPYPEFSDEELDALATYLAELPPLVAPK